MMADRFPHGEFHAPAMLYFQGVRHALPLRRHALPARVLHIFYADAVLLSRERETCLRYSATHATKHRYAIRRNYFDDDFAAFAHCSRASETFRAAHSRRRIAQYNEYFYRHDAVVAPLTVII